MRLACAILGLTLLLPAQQAAAPSLQSFYIGRSFTSDMISAWNEQILEAIPQNGGVRVRLIRLALANLDCTDVLVQAAEATLADTTVEHVAGQNLCAIDQRTIDRALKRAPHGKAIQEAGRLAIVAACDARERLLEFPQDITLDWKALERRDPPIASAGLLFSRLRERAFGKDFSFDTKDPQERRRQDDLGLAAVPDLLSPRFQTVLGSTFTQQLTGYTGPPSRELLPADLLERADLKFDTYVPVPVPQIAMTARVTGDVRLRVSVDRFTGAVTEVNAVSGPQLLAAAAARTVRLWRFTPASLTGDSAEVTLRFEPRCR